MLKIYWVNIVADIVLEDRSVVISDVLKLKIAYGIFVKLSKTIYRGVEDE